MENMTHENSKSSENVVNKSIKKFKLDFYLTEKLTVEQFRGVQKAFKKNGISKATVDRIRYATIGSEYNPSVKIMLAVAKVLNVTVEELINQNEQ